MAVFSLADLIDTVKNRRAMRTKVVNEETEPVPVQLTGSYVGYSSEEKPNGKQGDTFLEIDTGNVYIHDGQRWVEL